MFVGFVRCKRVDLCLFCIFLCFFFFILLVGVCRFLMIALGIKFICLLVFGADYYLVVVNFICLSFFFLFFLFGPLSVF